MPNSPEQSAAIIDIATGSRMGDSVRVERGRQNLVEANIARAIEVNLAKAPPLRADQIAKLSALLNGGTR